MSMIKKIAPLVWIGLLLMFGAGELRAEITGIQIVVHPDNAVAGLTMEELALILIGKSSEFPGGEKATVVDQPSDSEIYQFVADKVHGKTVNAMKGYWARQVFSGRGSPPRQLSNDAEVIAFVKSNPNSIGYVTQGAALEGVKAILIDGKANVR